MTSAERRGIDVRNFGHVNPIPAACRIGSLIPNTLILDSSDWCTWR